MVPVSTPSTSATLSHFNTIDNDAQIVPHSRVCHISSDYYHDTNSGNQSLCSEKQIINSNSADTDNKSIFASLPNFNNSQILETMVTVPIRSDSVQYDTVPPLLNPDTVHIRTVPEAAYTVLDSTDTVQYGTLLNQDSVLLTVPKRLTSVQCDIIPMCPTVPPLESPGAVHSDTVQKNALTKFYRPDTQEYGTLSNLNYVPATVPPSFVQGLSTPKRNNSSLRNKYIKMRKLSRTPIVVSRIIEYSKDDDPHLDQSNPLIVVSMDLEDAPLAVLEPVPGAPEITRTGVCSNSSPIRRSHHPKPNHARGGEEESYRFSAGVQKQSLCMPTAAQITEGKIRTSYRPRLSPDGRVTRVVHLVSTISARRAMPRRKIKSSHSRVTFADSSYKSGVSFNALNGEIIPDLYSDEYEFDANEYQKWHLDYKFNLDAAASILNHKCDNYASKDKSFLDLSAEDLHNKSIWMFPPIELAKEFLLHYEAIRLQQPDTMMAVICLPRLVTPGAD